MGQDIITRSNDTRLLQAAPLAYRDIALVDPSDGYGVTYQLFLLIHVLLTIVNHVLSNTSLLKKGKEYESPLELANPSLHHWRQCRGVISSIAAVMLVCYLSLCIKIFPLLYNTDGPYDTSSEDAIEQTYVPALKTFQEEMEIVHPKLPPLVHLDVDKLTKMYEREKKLEEKVYW